MREIKLFVWQFRSPLMLMLVGAVILSAFVWEISDVAIILSILLATGILGFFQERNANNAIEKLQSMIRIKNIVIREGKRIEIEGKNIVVWDLLLLAAGDIIPADCYILESNELHVNEASLTGESYPVRKTSTPTEESAPLEKRDNALWQGTNIVSGTASAIVVATGSNTVFGSIAKSMEVVHETAFEKGIKEFGFFLMKITVVLSLWVLAINILGREPIIDSILFALALAVGMAPELLPAIMTISMSAGAKRMLEKKVIVKTLSSIQNLWEINMLCTDKTGTITEGKIIIHGTVNIEWKEDSFVRTLAYLNATFESGFQNPIDEAIRALKLDITGYKKLGEIPYDFIRKRLSIVAQNGTNAQLITKGALKNILEVCTQTRLSDGTIVPIEEHKKTIEKHFTTYSSQWYRILGICYRDGVSKNLSRDHEDAMIFAGFVMMEDPIKEGIMETINVLEKQGIKLKIITGDNRYVAAHVAQKLWIHPDRILTGPEMIKIGPEALVIRVQKADIFAEIEPNQKEHIIQALQKRWHVVGYMGDGINDVAALNTADVGISINNATDVAQEAADFVLLEKNVSVISDGVREGRKTFANTLKYIFISSGSTLGNMISVAVASMLLPFLPMLPKQILITNFLTDFPYMAISGDNVDEEQLQKPGKWNLKKIRASMVVFWLHSSLFDMITFFTLYKLLQAPIHMFQTGWFLESTITELCILFIIRTQKSFFKSHPRKNLIYLSIVAIVMTLGIIYIPFSDKLDMYPLPLSIIGSIVVIVIFYTITADILKKYFFRRMNRIS